MSVEQSLVVKSANAGPSSRLEGKWYFFTGRHETLRLTKLSMLRDSYARHQTKRAFPATLISALTRIFSRFVEGEKNRDRGGIIKSGAHLQTLRHRVRKLFIRCLREYGKRIDTLHFLRDASTCFNSTFNRLKATLMYLSALVLATSCYLIRY